MQIVLISAILLGGKSTGESGGVVGGGVFLREVAVVDLEGGSLRQVGRTLYFPDSAFPRVLIT